MSEHITHVAACEDVTRLVAAMPAVPAPLRDAMTGRADAAQMGSITRRMDFFSVPLLHEARQRAEAAAAGGGKSPEPDAKLAFILGGLTHRSADRHMKPVFQHFKQQLDAARGFNECTIYCDVKILQEVYGGGGPDGPFPPGLLTPEAAASTAQLEELLRHVLRRTLISMHTINPDDQHPDQWLTALLDAEQDFKIKIERYIEVATRPDPVKVQRYLVDTNYYYPDAPIIQAARRLQAGETLIEADVATAIGGTGVKDGRYAQLLAGGVKYVRSVGFYFEHLIDEEELAKGLHIGVPELSLGFTLPPAS